jgi:catechol 2,3-dioxygenase-like lactoylglutathione lyase family enzyme
MRLSRLSHVFLNVYDIRRSRDFYTKILGFQLIEEDAEHGGTFLALEDGGHSLDLQQIAGPGEPQVAQRLANLKGTFGVAHIAFHVGSREELRDAYFELKDAGVPIINALDHKSQQSVYFLDPDGNVLELCWERPGARQMYASGRDDDDTPLVFERS